MRFFGRKKEPKPYDGPTLDQTSESMEKRVQFLRTKIAECDQDLSKLRNEIKNTRGSSSQMAKQRAVQVLKRKKMYSSQLDNLMGQQFNVEQLSFNQAGIQDTIDAVSAMRNAHQVQSQALKEINVDEVYDLMDDMEDLMIDTEEINEVMARSYGVDDVNEDELEAELAELDDDMLNENMMAGNLSVPSYLPSNPERKQEEDELTF